MVNVITARAILSGMEERQLIDCDQIELLSDFGSQSTSITITDLRRLIEGNIISPLEIARYLGSISNTEVMTDCLSIAIQAHNQVLSRTFLRENKLLPCIITSTDSDGKETRQSILLVANPFDDMNIKSAIKASGEILRVVVAPLDELEILLETHASPSGAASAGQTTKVDQNKASLDMLRDLASGTPVVTIVNELFEMAVDLRATDIHLEPTAGDLSIRYRIDGVLRKMDSRPAEFTNAIISRIKVLAKLDISERRRPQDGATRLLLRGLETDLRIATLPTNHGESVVIRLLARNSSLASLGSMGMSERDFAAMNRLLDHPYGMIAVTGPTGSGKTTTLAAALSQLNDTSRKIVTIEDPIEYQIENISQAQVHPEIGVTFANAIRAFVRQDPDVIMVGEIRDGDTAKAAVQAAQTGHLLLTTLHANTAISALARLRDLGVESYLLASNLRGVVAQRLVRVLCSHCKSKSTIRKEDFANESRYSLFDFHEGDEVYHAKGCQRCSGTGYRGRAPVFEICEINQEMAEAIGNQVSAIVLQEIAVKSGMKTLSQDARRRVADGITSPEEILRVTAYL